MALRDRPRHPQDEYDEYLEEGEYAYDRPRIRDREASDRRRSYDDDGHSLASSHRSHRSRRTSHQPRAASPARSALSALTEDNLKALTVVSKKPTPSAAGQGYRAPYAETAHQDMQVSRPGLVHAATMPVQSGNQSLVPGQLTKSNSDMVVPKRKKEIDMDLAYGSLPPDLAHRHDLDPVDEKSADAGPVDEPNATPEEAQALTLIEKIESFLDEAHCVHHSATNMISQLQQTPETAATVALTLAELSSLLGKMSPGFLGVLKGGSPAIFALLASPQFMIAAGVAVGVTVVMFGGWKIVKKIQNAATRQLEAPMTAAAGGALPPNAAANTGGGEASTNYEEAIVIDEELEEELSTIDTWRRGISVYEGDTDIESADIELMSQQADRVLRERASMRFDLDDREVEPDDSISSVGIAKSSSGRSHHGSRGHRSHRRHHDDEEPEIPERRGSRLKESHRAESEVSYRSDRSHRSERSHRSHRERERDRDDRGDRERDRDSRSEHGSSVSRSSRHSRRAIEDGRAEDESVVGDGVVKKKKNNMLKTLFKKMKEKERDGQSVVGGRSVVSVSKEKMGSSRSSRAMSVMV